MSNVAFIPARGGSKRVPNKNLQTVGGVELVVLAVRQALRRVHAYGPDGLTIEFGPAPCDFAVVSTDSVEIKSVVAREAAEFGARVLFHDRKPEHADDHAQIEDAIADWFSIVDDALARAARWEISGAFDPKVIVLLQPTSPLRRGADVAAALGILASTGGDSVVGVVRGHEHHFCGDLVREDDFLRYVPRRVGDAQGRPRTQDLPEGGHETGALYAFTAAHFRATRNRMGGRMYGCPMDRVSSLDVDTAEDLRLANVLMAARAAGTL